MLLSNKILPARRLVIMILALGTFAAGADDTSEVERYCQNTTGIHETMQELRQELTLIRSNRPNNEAAMKDNLAAMDGLNSSLQTLDSCMRTEFIRRAYEANVKEAASPAPHSIEEEFIDRNTR